MGKLLVKHWAGTITTNNVDRNSPHAVLSWGVNWQERARKAEDVGNTLVVFEIPKKLDTELIEEIEKLLRHRLQDDL